MNEPRNKGRSVTEGLPAGAKAWIVRDHAGKPWGPFHEPSTAGEWAELKWPHGAGGWEVEALWTPDI